MRFDPKSFDFGKKKAFPMRYVRRIVGCVCVSSVWSLGHPQSTSQRANALTFTRFMSKPPLLSAQPGAFLHERGESHARAGLDPQVREPRRVRLICAFHPSILTHPPTP